MVFNQGKIEWIGSLPQALDLPAIKAEQALIFQISEYKSMLAQLKCPRAPFFTKNFGICSLLPSLKLMRQGLRGVMNNGLGCKSHQMRRVLGFHSKISRQYTTQAAVCLQLPGHVFNAPLP